MLFAVGLIFFFMFSADYADGLEKTMEEADAGEESTFESPFSYGENYPHALVSGILGFLVMFIVISLYGRFVSGKVQDDEKRDHEQIGGVGHEDDKSCESKIGGKGSEKGKSCETLPNGKEPEGGKNCETLPNGKEPEGGKNCETLLNGKESEGSKSSQTLIGGKEPEGGEDFEDRPISIEESGNVKDQVSGTDRDTGLV